LVLLWVAGSAFAQEVPVVAAASDLKFALDEIAAAFQKESGKSVKITYGRLPAGAQHLTRPLRALAGARPVAAGRERRRTR